MKTSKPRFGLLAKIILFLAAVLIPLAAVTWLISVQTLRQRMTEEFTSKGTAIANSLASSGVDLILTRDASTVQALIDQFATISGVAYVMVYDPTEPQIAHTFVPFVPPDVVDKNVVPGDLAKQVRDIDVRRPGDRQAPRASSTSACRCWVARSARCGWAWIGRSSTPRRPAPAGSCSRSSPASPWWRAWPAWSSPAASPKPIAQIVRVAERVGRGDLSETVEGRRSGDEIG